MKDFVFNYFGEFLTMIIGGLGGWIFGRKKNLAEVEDVKARTDTVQIDNEIKLSNYYKDMLDDLKPRYERQLKEFQSACAAKEMLMREKEKLMREKVVLLKQENEILRQHIADRDKRIAELEKIKINVTKN
jgi:hypothetical protein